MSTYIYVRGLFKQALRALLLFYSLAQLRLSISRVYLRYDYLSHNAHSLQTFLPQVVFAPWPLEKVLRQIHQDKIKL